MAVMTAKEYREYLKKNKKKQLEDKLKSGQVLTADEYRELTGKETRKEQTDKQNTWFTKGAFEDGYQFGDFTKTLAGTTADGVSELGAGLIGIGEKAIDAGAYAVGGIGGLFSKDFKEDTKRFIAKDLYDESAVMENLLTFGTGIDLDKYSVLGEKADALARSGGELLTAAGLQTVGVPWWVTMGVSSFGSEVEGAFNQGAEYGEAGVSGLISAGLEVGLEKLTGGISFGGKSLSDGLKDTLSKGFSNKIANTLVKLGFDMAGEGTEEVLTEIGTAIGRKLTYEDDKTLNKLLWSEEAFQNYVDAFIGGAAMGGVANVRRASQSIASGRDYDTRLSVNEQKVVDKEVENRVAEKEKSGQKVDKKARAEIVEDVKEDLKRGFISIDTIESAIGGNTYDSVQSLSKEMEEYNQLNRMKAMDLTGEQVDRLAELKEKNKTTPYESEIARLKEQLSKEVSDVTMQGTDVYLQESYKEKSRRSQAFESGATKYKSEAAKTTVQNAVGKMNNTTRAHEFVDRLAKISEDKGIVFDFTDSKKIKELGYSIEGKTVNGYVQGNNVTLNLNSAQALNKVVGHEVTHFLEGTEHYDALQQAMEEYVNLKGEGEYNKRLAEITERYKDVQDADAKKELLADLVGEYLFTDEKFVRHLSTKNRNVFQKIYDEIKYLVKTFSGTKEGKQLAKVKKIFEQVYKEDVDISKSSLIKYSLMEFSEDGKRFVEIDQEQDRFEGRDRSEYPRIAKDIINEKFNGKVIGIDNKMFVNGQGRDEYANPSKFIQGDIYEAKMRAAGELDNLLDAGTNFRNEPDGRDGHYHTDVIGGFDYFDTLFKIGDNYYEATINIKNVKRGKLFKDVTQIKDVTQDIMSSYGQSPKSQFLRTSSTNSISQNQEKTTENQKKSLSDNAIAPEPAGGWNVKGKDIAFDAPIAEEFAPAQQNTEEEEVVQFKKANAQKIKNIEAKIKGLQMSREITQKEYNDSIAKKREEYNALQRKDTVRATKLLEQINNLEYRRDNAIAKLDRKIQGSRKGIQNIKSQEVARQRKVKQSSYRNLMSDLMGDTSTWKDKKWGISYQANTLRRNLRDVVLDADGNRDIARADAIYNELQGKYNQNEAELNRESNRIKQVFADLNINATENTYIQMLGEYRHNPDTTLSAEVMKEFYEKNKSKIDEAKVDKAIELSRELYDSLLHRVNSVLREQGMQEIGYREGYFPHFIEEKQSRLAKLFNWKTQNHDIPTDIAGLTEQFNPNRSWQSFNKHRTSDVTDYNFKKGLDSYVHGALDWIYHIEDIQKRRAFENEIRYRHSEKGIQEKLDEIYNNPFYDADEVQAKIDDVLKEARNPLNNFVTDLRKGTNVLAGKKDSGDRYIEEKTSRKIYSTMTNISNRVTANMVAGSISSALTNFIPITQSWGQVSPISSLKGMKDTLRSTFVDDGMIDKSDFLTNRLRQAENLYKDGWDKIGDKVGFLMEAIDSFTSQTVWRSKYIENINQGMSEDAAIKDADQFAENVIAGRSRGNMPTIFNEKNLATKMLTAFQLEVANQYGYMFKDMPQDMQNDTKGKLVKGYATMFIGAYVYNALYSTLTGRDAAFDPIGIVEELLQDLGLFGDDEEEDKKPIDAITDLATNVVEELPFVGGLVGGGRIPISSALPYDGFTVDSLTQMMSDLSEGDMTSFWQEMMNPVYYLAMPMGGGQLRKSIQGMSMFDDDLPIAGSYTNSGKLRYSVEDTPLNRLQAAVFGQYANRNAREYFDEGRTPLNEKKTQELVDLDLPISEYWSIQDKLKDKDKLAEKGDVIAQLDLPIAKKNLLINNIADREEPIDLTDYDLYDDFEEFDFATKNPETYAVLRERGISVKEYKEKYMQSAFMYTDDYAWAGNNPEKYMLSKVITNDIAKYKKYTSELSELQADKDKSGKAISGSLKRKKLEYINDLDLDYNSKIVLWKSLYPSDNQYNKQIVEYIGGLDELSYQEKIDILKELGFKVTADGKVRW